MTNKYVLEVDEKRIFYTPEFKKYFISEYNKGRRPTEIFRSAGLDPVILGSKRIERACARWKELYKSGGLEAFNNERIPLPKTNQRNEQEIIRLKNLVIKLYEENQEIRHQMNQLIEKHKQCMNAKTESAVV